MKKYELTDEILRCGRYTLRRIRALIDILGNDGEELAVDGELGGYVESEKNLDQNGRCWVGGNARVWGNARVLGNAQVGGNARVLGNAQVGGNARVWGNAQVWGNARVLGNAQVGGNAQVWENAVILQNNHYLTIGLIGSRDDTTTFTRNAAGAILVRCGCFYGSLDKFRKKVKETHGDSKYAKVYLMAADLAELQIDTTPIEEEETDETA